MSINKILKNKNLLTLIIASYIFIMIFLLSGYFDLLNKSIQNSTYLYKWIFNNWTANKNIIVVEIDESTLRKLWRFPFSRDSYSKIITNLNSKWAWIIWFDIIFTDNSNKKIDDKLAKSIKKAGNIILWTTKTTNNIIELPLDKFKKASKWVWYFPPNIYAKNKVTYSVTPYIEAKRYWYIDHFAIKIFKAYYSYIYNKNYVDYISTIQNGFLNLIPWKKILLSWKERKDIFTWKNKDDLLISYVNSNRFTKVSFFDIYDDNKFKLLSKKVNFKDKIILIWAAADGLQDNFFTPNQWEVYWIYIHANIINTILNNQYIRYFNENVEWILIFLLIIISVYFNLSRSWYVLLASNIAIVSIFLIIFQGFITYFTPLILNYSAELIFALILSLTISNTVKYIIENKQKWKLSKALWEYVSKDIASEILSEAGKINLDWENKKVAIFFSDIEWFTSVSEKFSPEKLVWFLREYLTDMSNIIMDEKWFINKYEWDAIMALWWVFWKSEERQDSYNACLSALKQQHNLIELNKIWKEKWFSEIKARIGIHIWNSIIWNIWAEGRKMEFTALWDSVNLASRLEWVNKFYGTYICVSEDIYMETKKDFEYRFLDKITVKWKSKAIKIYELICKTNDITNETLWKINKFQIAIDLYLEKDFKLALSRFEALAKDWDKPSITYIERCKKYIKTPPEDNWSWIWNMTEK